MLESLESRGSLPTPWAGGWGHCLAFPVYLGRTQGRDLSREMWGHFLWPLPALGDNLDPGAGPCSEWQKPGSQES